jgi:ubiquinone/menaquinone biosynthesis C-methylase UbiE
VPSPCSAQPTPSPAAHLAYAETPREFYEAKWVKTNASVRSLRNLLVKKERFFVRTLGGKRGTLLDLGCGGGWSFFRQFDLSIGLDVSLTSLYNAQTVYTDATLGSVTRIPLADNSCDVVVSLDVLGHIPFGYKDDLLAEIYRVLKPGGATVHYIETLSNDPLSRFSRSYPELHEAHFVAPEGHIGVESPSDTFARFRQAGFVPVHEVPVYKGFIYLDRFMQYFDNEFREKSQVIRAMTTMFRPLVQSKYITLAINLLITLCFEVCDPLLPNTWAGGALVYYKKPG